MNIIAIHSYIYIYNLIAIQNFAVFKNTTMILYINFINYSYLFVDLQYRDLTLQFFPGPDS